MFLLQITPPPPLLLHNSQPAMDPDNDTPFKHTSCTTVTTSMFLLQITHPHPYSSLHSSQPAMDPDNGTAARPPQQPAAAAEAAAVTVSPLHDELDYPDDFRVCEELGGWLSLTVKPVVYSVGIVGIILTVIVLSRKTMCT